VGKNLINFKSPKYRFNIMIKGLATLKQIKESKEIKANMVDDLKNLKNLLIYINLKLIPPQEEEELILDQKKYNFKEKKENKLSNLSNLAILSYYKSKK
jgi:hypothetical protein